MLQLTVVTHAREHLFFFANKRNIFYFFFNKHGINKYNDYHFLMH